MIRLSEVAKKERKNGTSWSEGQGMFAAKNKNGVYRRWISKDSKKNKENASKWASDTTPAKKKASPRKKGPGLTYSIQDGVNLKETKTADIKGWKVLNRSRTTAGADPTFMQEFDLRFPRKVNNHIVVSEFFGDWTIEYYVRGMPGKLRGITTDKADAFLKQVGAPTTGELERLNNQHENRELYMKKEDMAVAPMGATLGEDETGKYLCYGCDSNNASEKDGLCPECEKKSTMYEAVKSTPKNNYKIEITGFDKKSIPTFRSGKHPGIATITLFIYGAKDEQSAIKKAMDDNKSRIRKVGFLGPAKKCAVIVTRIRQDGNEIGTKKNKYVVTAESFEQRGEGKINLVELLDDKYKKLAKFDSASLADINLQ